VGLIMKLWNILHEGDITRTLLIGAAACPTILILLIFNVNKNPTDADIYSLQNYSTCFGRHSTHHQEYPQPLVQVILLVPLLPSYVVRVQIRPRRSHVGGEERHK